MGDSVAYFAYALDNLWEPRVSGRIVEVPQPAIFVESEESKANVKKSDVAIVKDGGITTKTPATIGYNEQTTVSFVNIDLRTTNRNREEFTDSLRSPGASRMFGVRDMDTNTHDRYGGLTGEVERICHVLRRGTNEYDKVEIEEVNDISNQSGANHYRAIVTVRLEETAKNVSPEM